MNNVRILYQLPSGEIRQLEITAAELKDRLFLDPLNLLVTTIIVEVAKPTASARIWLPTADGFDADVEVANGSLPPLPKRP